VDVASGVADDSGVKKDHAKVDAFIANAAAGSMEMA
jgi:phosphoribosylanthranilate isomerase